MPKRRPTTTQEEQERVGAKENTDDYWKGIGAEEEEEMKTINQEETKK